MQVDVFALFMLVFSYAVSGAPSQIDYALSISATVQYGVDGVSVAFGLAIDPALIYFKPAPAWMGWVSGDTCGESNGYAAWVAPTGRCADTLRHEMVHIAQRRAFGWFGAKILEAAGLGMEAVPEYTANNMLLPRGLNAPLLRIFIPLPLARSR